MKFSISMFFFLATLFFPVSMRAEPNTDLAAQLRQILKNNPEIVLEALRDNSEAVLDIVQQGSDLRRGRALHRQWEEDAKTPKSVNLEARPSRGPANAPVTLVAFSDFTCGYCQQAAFTIEQLLRRYPSQIRYVFKQLPANDSAMLGSRWFLAAMKQDEAKAWTLFAIIFDSQSELSADPLALLRKAAAEAGLNVAQLEKDLQTNATAYAKILTQDSEDAKALGFNGTPYFLINNLVVRGAIQLDNFVDAVEFALRVK